jgi:effector-binding domain-containing protein
VIETPEIIEIPAQQTAVILLRIPREEIRHVMGPAIDEVTAAVAAQGLKPAGPVFSHHFRMEPGVFDFEVGVPVKGEIKKAGRVVPGELRARRVVRTVYHGGYEGLAGAWQEFEAWIRGERLDTTIDLWESYLRGPESSSDAADWQTELNRPLMD